MLYLLLLFTLLLGGLLFWAGGNGLLLLELKGATIEINLLWVLGVVFVGLWILLFLQFLGRSLWGLRDRSRKQHQKEALLSLVVALFEQDRAALEAPLSFFQKTLGPLGVLKFLPWSFLESKTLPLQETAPSPPARASSPKERLRLYLSLKHGRPSFESLIQPLKDALKHAEVHRLSALATTFSSALAETPSLCEPLREPLLKYLSACEPSKDCDALALSLFSGLPAQALPRAARSLGGRLFELPSACALVCSRLSGEGEALEAILEGLAASLTPAAPLWKFSLLSSHLQKGALLSRLQKEIDAHPSFGGLWMLGEVMDRLSLFGPALRYRRLALLHASECPDSEFLKQLKGAAASGESKVAAMRLKEVSPSSPALENPYLRAYAPSQTEAASSEDPLANVSADDLYPTKIRRDAAQSPSSSDQETE